jgi:hypothetical protein
MPAYVRPLGWIALLFGTATAILALLPGNAQLLSLPMMLMGLGISTLYLMLSTRYKLEHQFIHPGYIGMLLSSVPIFLLIYFKFVGK